MPQYNETLGTLVARVLQVKPNAQQSEIVRSLNARVRSALNVRIYWADLLARRIISLPAPYATGTVSFTTGSVIVTGTATAFPVTDVVNTTSTTAVVDAGFQQITPASMAKIGVDTMLFCDAAGTPETVPVVEVTPTSFWAKFSLPHSVSFTLTSSSLAGLQIHPGTNYPFFTVRAVRDTSTLEIDNPWGGPALANHSYQIVKIYTTIDPHLKVILDCVDQQTGITIDTYVPIEKINARDPQREDSGDPLALVQVGPTESGSMMYEVYPWATTARQLMVYCGLQWPEMKMQFDRPPFFLDPTIFVEGACADMLRIRNLRMTPGSNVDPFFDPALANTYEQLFRLHLQEQVNADQALHQTDYQDGSATRMGWGGSFGQSHDPDLFYGRW